MTLPKYKARVAALPCFCCQRTPPSETHHSTVGRGLGQTNPDSELIPLCTICHRDFHAGSGRFRFMGKMQRREWQHGAVAATQKRLSRPQE